MLGEEDVARPRDGEERGRQEQREREAPRHDRRGSRFRLQWMTIEAAFVTITKGATRKRPGQDIHAAEGRTGAQADGV